jgi:glycolate oxidase
MTSSLRSSLAAIVGEKYVSDQDFVRRSYTRGPSWGRGGVPGIVVKPGTTEEVSQIVRLANDLKTPVIPRGGGASTAIGGFPRSDYVESSILVDITRMNRFLYLDEDNMVAAAEAGIILSQVSATIYEKGFHMYTVDIPQYIDTLGGVLSGFNGGGEPSDLAVVGEIGNFILGLEVVLPNGDVITTGAGPGTNIYTNHMVDRTPGSPNITGMFLGDSGVFGIKTKVYFRVFPKQAEFIYGAIQYENFDDMWDVISKLTRIDPYLYTRMVGILPVWEKRWTIFFVILGAKEEVEFKEMWLKKICKEGGGVEISNTLARDIIMTFSGRQLGKYYASRGKFRYFEHILRKSDAPDFLSKQTKLLTEKIKDAGLEQFVTDSLKYIVPKERHSVVMGHLYFMDEAKMSEEQKEAFIQICHEETDHLLKYGGFIEGAQGDLTRKSAGVWQPTYHNFMKSIKRALDPNNILNPGLWGF